MITKHLFGIFFLNHKKIYDFSKISSEEENIFSKLFSQACFNNKDKYPIVVFFLPYINSQI